MEMASRSLSRECAPLEGRRLFKRFIAHERGIASEPSTREVPLSRGGARLSRLIRILEAARSRGSSRRVSELLEALKAMGELEKAYAAGRAAEGLKAEGLLGVREYVKEALYRLATGETTAASWRKP